MSQWVSFLTYLWMGKCLLTLLSEFSLLVPGPNEELFFLAASVATKREFTRTADEVVEQSLYQGLGGSGALRNPTSPHPQPLWEVLFLKLYSDLHR